jgi:hypothetical protein
MNTDNFFITGTTHRICQDYAMSNERKAGQIVGQPFVVVSDGCSTAIHTDIGARLLTIAARPHIFKPFDTNAFLYGVITGANTFCRTLELPVEALTATLMVAKVEGDNFHVLVVGDGTIAYKNKNGMLVIREIIFPSGAAYYLRYELNEENKERYFKEFGNTFIVRTTTILPSGDVADQNEEERTINKTSPYFSIRLPLDCFSLLSIMSDGVSAFTKLVKDGTSVSQIPVPSIDVVPELLAFKGYQGDFVQRRVKRAMETFNKAQLQNTDDVAVGVIANI